MTRRSHTVRTDDQGGLGATRSLGGCEIFCAAEEGGEVPEGDDTLVAPITITSTRDYQRCFVAATIGHITAYVPDPPPLPGPGSWTVRFEYNGSVVPEDSYWRGTPYYASTQWDVPGVTKVEYDGNIHWGDGGPFSWDSSIQYLGDWSEWYQEFIFVPPYPHLEVADPPYSLTDDNLRLFVKEGDGPLWCELTFYSDFGEFMVDQTVSGGSYVTE